VEKQIAELILADSCVVDIYKLRVMQEGRAYHVDAIVELRKGLSLAEADDTVFSLTDELLKSTNITDVDLGIIEDDNRRSEEHTSELQSRFDLVCRLLLEKKKYE